MKNTTVALIIFIAGIIIVCFAPYVFTRSGPISFEETGTIGDTIGGITAPITSLLGSFLVYFALRAQIDANKLIQDQIKDQKTEEINRKRIQSITDQIAMVKFDLNDFTYSHVQTVVEYETWGIKSQRTVITPLKGSEGINHLAGQIMAGRIVDNSDPKEMELYHLIETIKFIFNKIEKSDVPLEDKMLFKSQLTYLFNSKIKPAFMSTEDRFPKSNVGLHKRLFELVLQLGSHLAE